MEIIDLRTFNEEKPKFVEFEEEAAKKLERLSNEEIRVKDKYNDKKMMDNLQDKDREKYENFRIK